MHYLRLMIAPVFLVFASKLLSSLKVLILKKFAAGGTRGKMEQMIY